MTTELQTELSLFINSINGVSGTIPTIISDWLYWNMGCAIFGSLIGIIIIGVWFIFRKYINNREPTFELDKPEKQFIIIISGVFMWFIGVLVFVLNAITIIKIMVFPNVFIIDKLLSIGCS